MRREIRGRIYKEWGGSVWSSDPGLLRLLLCQRLFLLLLLQRNPDLLRLGCCIGYSAWELRLDGGGWLWMGSDGTVEWSDAGHEISGCKGWCLRRFLERRWHVAGEGMVTAGRTGCVRTERSLHSLSKMFRTTGVLDCRTGMASAGRSSQALSRKSYGLRRDEVNEGSASEYRSPHEPSNPTRSCASADNGWLASGIPSISDPELERLQGRGMQGSPGGYLGTSWTIKTSPSSSGNSGDRGGSVAQTSASDSRLSRMGISTDVSTSSGKTLFLFVT